MATGIGQPYRPPDHHIWAGPGLRGEVETTGPLRVAFDTATLDLVAHLPNRLGEAIAQHELPHLCDSRPHEDPCVEAWLQRWLDGVGPDPGVALVLEASSLVGLQLLAEERPEVCPLLRAQLDRFERAVVAWLQAWPGTEPAREGLPPQGSADEAALVAARPSAEELELQLYAVHYLLETQVREVVGEVVSVFQEVAVGWALKLHTLYGLRLDGQPERVSQAAGGAGVVLSTLDWSLEQVLSLLRCPFFRPPEAELRAFALRWSRARPEGGGDGGALEPALEEALVGELLRPISERASAAESPPVSEPQEPVAEPTEGAAAAETDEEAAGRALAPAPPLPSAPTLIPGGCFERVARHKTCTMLPFDDPSGLEVRMLETGGVRIWNKATEAQIVGAARQMLAAKLPMSSGGGRFRLDLRVLAGVEAEAAHLLELGLAADPFAGVRFGAGEVGAGRPPEFENGRISVASPFFRLAAVPDLLLEGVRLVAEVDFDEALVHLRNLPGLPGCESAEPTPLAAWLTERARSAAIRARPGGELDCPLFREHAEHLYDLIDRDLMDSDLAASVLGDVGASCVLGKGAIVPEKPEDYHFYIVVPAGMEVEIF